MEGLQNEAGKAVCTATTEDIKQLCRLRTEKQGHWQKWGLGFLIGWPGRLYGEGRHLSSTDRQ